MKVMKKFLTGGMIVMMVLFLSAGLGLAGSKNGQGAGDGTGPLHFIIPNSEFMVTGEVVSLVTGEGLIIAPEDNGLENITIYGIGPVKYWDSQEVIRPAVGDAVTVVGYQVDYNGEIRKYRHQHNGRR